MVREELVAPGKRKSAVQVAPLRSGGCGSRGSGGSHQTQHTSLVAAPARLRTALLSGRQDPRRGAHGLGCRPSELLFSDRRDKANHLDTEGSIIAVLFFRGHRVLPFCPVLRRRSALLRELLGSRILCGRLGSPGAARTHALTIDSPSEREDEEDYEGEEQGVHLSFGA